MSESENASLDLQSRNKAFEKGRVVEQLENMPIVEIACKRANVSRAT